MDLRHVVEDGDRAEQVAMAREAHRVHLQLASAQSTELDLAHDGRGAEQSLRERGVHLDAPDHLDGRPSLDGAPHAEQLPQPRVGQDHRAAAVEDEHALDHALEHGAQPGLLVVACASRRRSCSTMSSSTRDRSELVARSPGQPLREIAGRNGLDDPLQLVHPALEQRGEDGRKQGRQYEAGKGRRQQGLGERADLGRDPRRVRRRQGAALLGVAI